MKPLEDESQDAFIDRYMSDADMTTTHPDAKARAMHGYRAWRQARGNAAAVIQARMLLKKSSPADATAIKEMWSRTIDAANRAVVLF